MIVMQFSSYLRCFRKIRIRLLQSGLGDKRFLSEEILFPFFLGFYLLGIIPVIVPIFAFLGIYKGMGALGINSRQIESDHRLHLQLVTLIVM